MEVLSSRTLVYPSDLDRSLDFYGTALGLAVAREFGQGQTRGVVFYAGGGLIEVVGAGWRAEGTGTRVSASGGSIGLWLQVRSVEATLAELADHGVPIVKPARLEPWGLIEAWIEDPDGLPIHLVEVPPDHPLRRDTRGPPGGGRT